MAWAARERRETGSVGLRTGYSGTAWRVPEPQHRKHTQARHTPLARTSYQHTVGHDGQTDMHGICQALEGRYKDPTARCARARAHTHARTHVHTHTYTVVHTSPTDTQGTRERLAQQQGR